MRSLFKILFAIVNYIAKPINKFRVYLFRKEVEAKIKDPRTSAQMLKLADEIKRKNESQRLLDQRQKYLGKRGKSKKASLK